MLTENQQFLDVSTYWRIDMKHIQITVAALACSTLVCCISCSTKKGEIQESTLSKAWAGNSVNAVIFRRDPLTSHDGYQYVSFYNNDGEILLGRRITGTGEWDLTTTPYTGNIKDAHNTISICTDGSGILHMAWDHHGHPLHYCTSAEPGSTELTGMKSMTGQYEDRVTYPEFFRLPDGGLLFLYRHGSSGNGLTMLNRYDTASRSWQTIQHPLISGEGERNAYTNQIAIDNKGVWHISWCWREHGGVETNHDLCYGRSADDGLTWEMSDGEKYTLPITMSNAEVVKSIPQNREYINHTTMDTDSRGNPYIATYWTPRGSDVPQYHIVYHDGEGWHTVQVGERTQSFSLSGGGTKRIPISRPRLLIDRNDRIYMIFRDDERGNRVSVATTGDIASSEWEFFDLTDYSVGQWEPSCDSVLWDTEGILSLYVQLVGQGDGETTENLSSQTVHVIDWKPAF